MQTQVRSFDKSQLAEYLGVKTSRTIANWTRRKRFPLPFEKHYLNESTWKYIFHEDQVQEWLGQLSGGHEEGGR